MREIKFKAWNATMCQMIDLQKLTSLTTDLQGLFIPKSGDIIPLQFTGLHDKNGKEIYEGDIIQWVWTNGKRGWIMHIEYDNNRGCFYTPDGGATSAEQWHDWCEVIGNIYQNPELLK
jgi:uncharacterized phage protein (TIGR01671 family)